MTDKKNKQKKEFIEEPIIDKSGESLKKIISKGKKQGFLKDLNVKEFLQMKVSMIKKNFIQRSRV